MSKKILIVEDGKTIQLELQVILGRENYVIEVVDNGVEALKSLKKSVPDLILLDIMMPEMDGIECCAKIRADKRFDNVKIVILSAVEEYEKVDEAFDAGCDDFLAKPIGRKDLLDKIEMLTKIKDLK
ncbi:MAG: response regulator [Deltaproteobacteria bacterium]|nr:response regulator [Deltaproteobacteria bacterium]